MSIHPKAMNLINRALGEVVRKGRKADRFQLYVWSQSELAKSQTIKTAFGDLRIRPDEYLSKGYSYIREDLGGGQIGFAWVCFPKTANIYENRKDQKHA